MNNYHYPRLNTFEGGGQVVIYDANNGIKAVRQALAERFDQAGIHVVLLGALTPLTPAETCILSIPLETICDDKEIIENNIRSVKISSPDYRGWDPNKAVEDYYKRIHDHEKYYETIDDRTWPYILVIERPTVSYSQALQVGEKIMLNVRQVDYRRADISHLSSEYSGLPPIEDCVFPDEHSQPIPHDILCKSMLAFSESLQVITSFESGPSLIEHSYKADADLSPAGWEYADHLKDFLLDRRAKSLKERGVDPHERKLVIWTSTHRRAHHTAWPFLATAQTLNATDGISLAPSPEPTSSMSTVGKTAVSKASGPVLNVKVVEKPQMLEINPGIWDGLSPEQAKKYYPEDWDRFLKDPYSFRAPRAESYHDLSVRLDPVLIELEKEQEDLLIIGHASVIRCMLAYLIGLPASEIPAIEIARGDLIEVVPASYGVHSQAFHFWDGPGRRGPPDPDVAGKDDNFYENYAEDTKGKRNVNTPEPSIIRGN
ncbi:hypothetical protein H0H93_014049 [Arthromyces matolae]|nr:hypothetical protein H0H93_014049 [Arthromyces matolae]